MRGRLSLLVILYSLTIPAQESQFEQMRRELSENSLPLVNMIVDIENVPTSSYVPGEIEIADFMRRTDANTDVVRYHCQYRIRGGHTTLYEKKSFAVKLTDEFGKDLDANIFGIREENSWILDAMTIDRIRMRNRVCFDVWNDMSRTPYQTNYDNRNGTMGQFCEVYINGDYHGLYCMTDKIDRKLLGLKKAKVDDGGDVTVKGLLYKGIIWGSGIQLLSYEEADVDTDTWNAWELQYPDDYPSIDTWQPLMDLINFCSDETSDEAFRQGWEEWFWKDNLADYVVLTLAMNVGDNGYKNTFLSTVNIQEGHQYLITPWDMDMSLGGNYNGGYYSKLADINRYDGVAPFNRLTVQNIDGFKNLQKSKWTEYSETLFSCESISRRLDDYGKLLTVSGAWDREYAKWNGNPVPLKKDIADELKYVKDWYAKNHESLCHQFIVKIPTGISNVVSDAAHRGEIYTLDGRRIEGCALNKGIYILNGKKIMVR